jgi:cytochrome c biogenesis protein CcmG/thiol:disulfide interchange protein DsbE
MSRFVAPLLLFIPLCIALGFALFVPPAAPIQRSSQIMPAITLYALDAPETAVSFQAPAGRITILNFFASWCVPCLAEHAQWKKFIKPAGVSLQGIAWNDTPQNAQAWLKKHGNPYDNVWLDRKGRAALGIGLRGVPETYVIDRDGKVKLHIQGAMTAPLRAQLESLLARMDVEDGDAPVR